MKTSAFYGVSAAMLLAALPLVPLAQQPTSATGTGMVTGHVTCGDSQLPARFAQVVLYAIPAEVTAIKKVDPNADAATQMMAGLAALKDLGKTAMSQTQTGADGNFVALDVAPGDYYVFAAASGYVTPVRQIESLIAAGADTKKQFTGIPVVHVSADHTSTTAVTMERGGAISGTVVWEDGSPVTGAVMTVLQGDGTEAKPPQQFAMLAIAGALGSLSITDDLGHFRLSGLPTGSYLVKATIQTSQQSGIGSGGMNLTKMMAASPLVLYAPSAFHKGDAKAVTLHAAEDVRDQQMTLNLGGLHSVSGRIASAEDHHGINSAIIRLMDANDKEFARSASVDAAGNFTVTYVPNGTYTLKVSEAEDTEPEKKTGKDKEKLSIFASEKTIRSYKDGTLSVIVADSDLAGQNVDLMVDKHPKSDADYDKMFKDALGTDDDKSSK